MKYQKLLIIAASVCLSAFFVSGAAQAQITDPNLQSIVEDYCVQVDMTVADAETEIVTARMELEGCSDDFESCKDTLGLDDYSKCINANLRCIEFGTKNLLFACRGFLREWAYDTRRAEKRARKNGVQGDFYDWLNGNVFPPIDPTSDDCLEDAFSLSDVCTGQ